MPVALVYDGSTHAVMMATPADLEDFAVGFSLTEGVIASRAEIRELEIVEHDKGIEARMWLVPRRGRDARRAPPPHRRARPACGLCGVESLEAAVPPAQARRRHGTVTPDEIQHALARAAAGADAQSSRPARCMPPAFWDSDRGPHRARARGRRPAQCARQARRRAEPDRGSIRREGFVVLTSRVSVEMVQKAAMLGAEIVVAVSAPTALALRVAEAAGITLVAIARPDAFEIFTHPHRISLAAERGDSARHEVHVHALHH